MASRSDTDSTLRVGVKPPLPVVTCESTFGSSIGKLAGAVVEVMLPEEPAKLISPLTPNTIVLVAGSGRRHRCRRRGDEVAASPTAR